MDHQADNTFVFSSKKLVFRVLAIDDAGGSHAARPVLKRSEPVSRTKQGSAIWLSPAMEDAVDEWAAAQPDPKPGRLEAIPRLLDRALAAPPSVR